MTALQKFALWFDGKKTIIGSVGLNILQMDLDVYTKINADVYSVLIYAFSALAAGGLFHKIQKGVKSKNA